MSDIAEHFNALREMSKDKRESNRENSAQVLRDHGVTFSERNYGAHLIIRYGLITADFWPGTGKWKVREGGSGRGVFELLRALDIKPNSEVAK